MACVGGPGRLGRSSAGDSLRCSATRGAVASKPLLGPRKVLRERTGARMPKTQVSQKRMRSPLLWGGQKHPGDHAPPRGGPWAPFWAFGYVITDLRIYPPPSPSHAPRSDPVTRIYESSYRRGVCKRGSGLRPPCDLYGGAYGCALSDPFYAFPSFNEAEGPWRGGGRASVRAHGARSHCGLISYLTSHVHGPCRPRGGAVRERRIGDRAGSQ
jgi:hypothetical protein